MHQAWEGELGGRRVGRGGAEEKDGDRTNYKSHHIREFKPVFTK